MEYDLNDIVEMKKQHPCKKSNQWKIIRMGADIKIKCLGCGAIIMFSRRDFEKRLKKVIPHVDQTYRRKDNQEVEQLIRTCLIEFEANKPGCAREDPDLGSFSNVY